MSMILKMAMMILMTSKKRTAFGARLRCSVIYSLESKELVFCNIQAKRVVILTYEPFPNITEKESIQPLFQRCINR